MGSISGEWKAWLTCRRCARPHRPAGQDAASTEPRLAGDHHRRRAVNRGDAHRVLMTCEETARRPRRGRDANIAPPGSAPISRPRAADQRARVRQREHPADVGGGQFTDRMARQQVRRNAPRFEHAVQGHLDREQCALRIPRLAQQAAIGRSRRANTMSRNGRSRRASSAAAPDRVECLGVSGDRARTAHAHARPLSALAGEEVGELAPVFHAADDARGLRHPQRAPGLAASPRGPTPRSPRARWSSAARMSRARRPSPIGDIAVRSLTYDRKRSACARSAAALRAESTSGMVPYRRLTRRAVRRRRSVAGRGLLQDHVGVGAADAERGDTPRGAARHRRQATAPAR